MVPNLLVIQVGVAEQVKWEVDGWISERNKAG